MTTSTTELRKRFYQRASVSEATDYRAAGRPVYRVDLDGRNLLTPDKRQLAMPSREIAEALAAEWEAQTPHIDPRTMPLTRLVNSAIDGVADHMAEVRAGILAYAGSDHLCYLADGPIELVERQSRRWGEIHAWARQAHGIEMALATGVMPVAQSPGMLARVDAALGETSALELAALHVITTLTGSLLLVLALRAGQITPEEAWSLAHIDEDFQIEQWGADAEAGERRQRRWTEMDTAARLLAWCSSHRR